MTRFKSRKKQRRLQRFDFPPPIDYGEIPARLKFNFSLLDTSQEHAHSFSSITEEQRLKLINKLVLMSGGSRKHWETDRSGILNVYKDFPDKSCFTHPSNVPSDVSWARFRIEGDFRLAGFFIPDHLDGEMHEKTQVRFDRNTFYAVFIDPEHKFYPSPRR